MEITINMDEIKNIQKYIESNIDYIKKLSDDIVKSYTGVLDDIMKDIKENIIDSPNVTDSVLESYFLELTNALYFIGSKSEFLGLFEDFSKSNMRIKYNTAYSDSQINGITTGKKATVDDSRNYAEASSMNDALVNALYSRSFKIVKAKVDSAQEMVKTLSKIISKRMNERDYSDYSNNIQNDGENRWR